MATLNKYTQKQIDCFYQWNINEDTTREELLAWVIKLLPQDDFDSMVDDAVDAMDLSE